MNLPIAISPVNNPEAISAIGCLFLICCAFAAQYWAYRCHQELKITNAKLDRLLADKNKL